MWPMCLKRTVGWCGLLFRPTTGTGSTSNSTMDSPSALRFTMRLLSFDSCTIRFHFPWVQKYSEVFPMLPRKIQRLSLGPELCSFRWFVANKPRCLVSLVRSQTGQKSQMVSKDVKMSWDNFWYPNVGRSILQLFWYPWRIARDFQVFQAVNILTCVSTVCSCSTPCLWRNLWFIPFTSIPAIIFHYFHLQDC